jgi:hypothetical protein
VHKRAGHIDSAPPRNWLAWCRATSVWGIEGCLAGQLLDEGRAGTRQRQPCGWDSAALLRRLKRKQEQCDGQRAARQRTLRDARAANREAFIRHGVRQRDGQSACVCACACAGGRQKGWSEARWQRVGTACEPPATPPPQALAGAAACIARAPRLSQICGIRRSGPTPATRAPTSAHAAQSNSQGDRRRPARLRQAPS